MHLKVKVERKVLFRSLNLKKLFSKLICDMIIYEYLLYYCKIVSSKVQFQLKPKTNLSM